MLIGLREAVEDGVLPRTLKAVRHARTCDPSFPVSQGMRGRELLYAVAELQGWERSRPSVVRAVHAAAGQRRCAICKQVQPVREFGVFRDRVKSHCRTCCAAVQRSRYGQLTDEEKRLKARRESVRRHGLTEARYQAMWDSQQGLCALCLRPEWQTSRWSDEPMRLAVDHDHGCCPGPWSCGGCVRGLLCHSCNQALGKIAESEEQRRRLAAYLQLEMHGWIKASHEGKP